MTFVPENLGLSSTSEAVEKNNHEKRGKTIEDTKYREQEALASSAGNTTPREKGKRNFSASKKIQRQEKKGKKIFSVKEAYTKSGKEYGTK